MFGSIQSLRAGSIIAAKIVEPENVTIFAPAVAGING